MEEIDDRIARMARRVSRRELDQVVEVAVERIRAERLVARANGGGRGRRRQQRCRERGDEEATSHPSMLPNGAR